MLYLGIDQHAKQLTVSLRDEAGDVLLARQVSTRAEKVRAFFEELERRWETEGGYVAIVEVCGFNDWLLALLPRHGCQQTVRVQPTGKSRRKTDRRDASALSDLLWVNRERLLAGKPVRGLRRVVVPDTIDAENRRLTTVRRETARWVTRLINQVRHILRRHNLQWEMPTKTFPTVTAVAWLKALKLPDVDRQEMNWLLEDIERLKLRLRAIDRSIEERSRGIVEVELLRTLPGVRYFTALALASRVGDVRRFPRARSLANYWGITPGCRNSGEKTDRLGSITKQGSSMARWLLAQVTLHVLRKDARMRAWYKRIKHRRGSKIARVAVMRRVATIIWHMLTKEQSYNAHRLSPEPSG